jgi:hypothetical protein
VAQNLVGGLFGKKKAAAAPVATSQPGTGTPSGVASETSTTVAEISVETTAIDPAHVPAEQFEVPARWKKLDPNPESDDALPSCPGS